MQYENVNNVTLYESNLDFYKNSKVFFNLF